MAAAILDWSSHPAPDHEQWDSLTSLLHQVPHIPVIVLGAGESVGLRERALGAGASTYLMPSTPEELGRAVGDAISTTESFRRKLGAAPGGSRQASVIAVLGAKGGVGTTMLAWNISALLAQRGSVILAEIRPAPGSLAYYFRPARTVRRLSDSLNQAPASTGARSVESCLWSSATTPGLRVLFGPQTREEWREIDAGAAKAIVQSIAGSADYVVLDLPASMSPANRAVLEESDYLALVMEREPVCVEAAKSILGAIESWDAVPPMSGIAIVNRVPLASPLPIEDIEARLGLPILTVIPPAADLCLQSQKARVPIVQLDPESLAAESIVALARGFQSKRGPKREAGPGSVGRK